MVPVLLSLGIFELNEWMNCYCGMVDRRKAFSLISSRDHCQRSSPSRISDMPWAGFEPAQNMSSGFAEWSCAVVITTTPHLLLVFLLLLWASNCLQGSLLQFVFSYWKATYQNFSNVNHKSIVTMDEVLQILQKNVPECPTITTPINKNPNEVSKCSD